MSEPTVNAATMAVGRIRQILELARNMASALAILCMPDLANYILTLINHIEADLVVIEAFVLEER